MSTDEGASAPTAPEPKSSARTKLWHNVAVRLADEGVPVRAIVRALMLPAEEVREVLEAASERGMILNIPRDDWPPGTRRDERTPDTVPLELEDDRLVMLAMRTFTLTQAMAKMFVALLRRPEMSKNSLHLVTLRDDGANYPTAGRDPTHIKIVDVFICKLRERMKKFAEANPQYPGLPIEIVTVWGRGYYIPVDGKEAIFNVLGIKHDTFAIPAGAPTDPH